MSNRPCLKILKDAWVKETTIFKHILISIHVHPLCVCVGGVQAMVWLSLFHCVEQ